MNIFDKLHKKLDKIEKKADDVSLLCAQLRDTLEELEENPDMIEDSLDEDILEDELEEEE